jgi:hypothetical protein
MKGIFDDIEVFVIICKNYHHFFLESNISILYMIDFLKKTFFEPRIAFSIFIICLAGYIAFLAEEKAFSAGFLKFGPDPDLKFLGMKVNTWNRVILLYVIGFFSAILTAYYQTVMFDFIHSKLWNPAYTKKMQVSKLWATIVVSVEPVLYWILSILKFFLTLTIRLQFLLPQLFGQLLVNIPYNIMKVGEKKFI